MAWTSFCGKPCSDSCRQNLGESVGNWHPQKKFQLCCALVMHALVYMSHVVTTTLDKHRHVKHIGASPGLAPHPGEASPRDGQMIQMDQIIKVLERLWSFIGSKHRSDVNINQCTTDKRCNYHRCFSKKKTRRLEKQHIQSILKYWIREDPSQTYYLLVLCCVICRFCLFLCC